MPRSLKIAVIGAGVSGLATARELQSEGHQVIVYEKADQIGGIWLYTEESESEDPLGIDPDRKVVHSSSYASLRSNLPWQLMGFPDYPFKIKTNGKIRTFPGREEILQFLSEFAKEFGLAELIRFNTEVVRAEQKDDDSWVVESRRIDDQIQTSSEEAFAAVVVCNGHYSQPKQAAVPGIEKWPGRQTHSHNYRIPEPYRDQVVILIGSGPSAYDICEEISIVAKEVHLSSRWPGVIASKVEMFDNVWLHCEIIYCHENGEVAFDDGASVAADIILHCTGYKYDFPFLKTNGTVVVDNNRVGPLYKHVFPPRLAPTLSFVGIPYKAPIFTMIYFQAKWVAHVLSGKSVLPSPEEMLEDVEQHYRLMQENGVPENHTHGLAHGLALSTSEYLDWLGSQVERPLDTEIKEIFGICAQGLMTTGLWSRLREEYIDHWIPHSTSDN